MRVTLIHPEFGYGGSERVMLDIAVELSSRGHDVVVLTHRISRPIAASDCGSARIVTVAPWVPRHVGQRLRAPLTLAGLSVLAVASRARLRSSDVVLVDLAAHVVPLLRRITSAAIVFYCHFPDALLAPDRSGPHRAYALYRQPIDALERKGLWAADRVVVNSRYTREALAAFARTSTEPVVVPPGVDPGLFDSIPPLAEAPPPSPLRVLTFARLDASKNLLLAVEAVAALREMLEAPAFAAVRLTIAGGVTSWRGEQRRTEIELRSRAAVLGIADRVEIVANPDDRRRLQLFDDATVVLHTSIGEHFGITILEAMAAARPVVAVDAGGPRETIVSGETGWLCAPDPKSIATALGRALVDRRTAVRMGAAGRVRVAQAYTRQHFGDQIAEVAADAIASRSYHQTD